MNRRRILAVIMSVFMILSLLPMTVFAAETAAVLDGQLKVQGSAVAGTILSADFQGIKTEGITEDSVSYAWFRKTPDDEKKEQQGETPELKQLGKEKTYTVTSDDVDSKIVLTVTGLEDKGFSGSLTAVTATVTAEANMPEASAAEQNPVISQTPESTEQNAAQEETTAEETAEIPEAKSDDEAGSESVDGIPAATEDSEESVPEQDEELEQNEYQEQLYPETDTETSIDRKSDSETAGGSSVDGIPAATEDGTYESSEEDSDDSEDTSYQADVEIGDGSSDVLEFGTVISGEEDKQAQYITIWNTGTEALNFIEVSPSPEHFVVQDITEPLEAGQAIQVRVAPRAGTQPGTYDDTISYQTEEGVEVSFRAQMTLKNSEAEIIPPEEPEVPQKPELVSKVVADRNGVEFGTVIEGYSEPPQAQTVTLSNQGNEDAVLSDIVSNQGEIKYFDVSLSSQTVSAGGTDPVTFTVSPKTGLTAGDYTESFTITDTVSGENVVITASVTVAAAQHSLGISTDTLDFASAKKGYSKVADQQITVTNNGNVAETLTQPSAKYFSITADTSDMTIQPGAVVTFTVSPKDGLEVNNYKETIKIVSAATETAFKASFQVLKGTVSLTGIQNPTEITGIANGTAKDAQKLQLPSAVVIQTTGQNAKAKVTWDVQNCAYDVSDTSAQSFTVKGSVTLPDGVDNDKNIELTAYAKVNVEAYTPKPVSADNNKITGIEYNGVYTTQSKISFTAAGAGMDNNSPKKGDVRYVPLNWTVINTNVWDKAPYTACFGLSKSGDYTLKVVFQQQQYSGEEWKNTEEQDTKQVAFSISEAKVTAPGTNLNSSANQKKTVKTNDPTVILPFVIILIIAAGAVCGVICYKKRKRK